VKSLVVIACPSRHVPSPGIESSASHATERSEVSRVSINMRVISLEERSYASRRKTVRHATSANAKKKKKTRMLQTVLRKL
jgi:hypothetical protein